MSDGTAIEWTDATWNPVRGCTRVSEGCRFCYAERVAARFSGAGQPYEGLARMTRKGPRWTGKVRLVDEQLVTPLRWRKPRLVFVNSMSDLFQDRVPELAVDRIFAVMALARAHRFQILTKRPMIMHDYVHRFGELTVPERAQRMAAALEPLRLGFIANMCLEWPLPNVWLGVSIEDQPTADWRLPILCDTPAVVRFVSAEPLLARVDIAEWLDRIHWLIAGGESGPEARPMHPDWARHLRDQCAFGNVPFFFKQWGEWSPIDAHHPVHPGCRRAPEIDMCRIGKAAAGAALDGVEHREWPA